MKISTILQKWATSLLDFFIFTYSKTGPAREANARASVCENCANTHTRLSFHLKAIDESLLHAQKKKHVLLKFRQNVNSRAIKNRRSQLNQNFLVQQQQQQQQQQDGIFQDDDLEALENYISYLKTQRKEIERLLESTSKQMQRLMK